METERKVLHDISTPLTTLLIHLEQSLEIVVSKNPDQLDECAGRIEKCIKQINKIAGIIEARRQFLKSGEA